jgi:eukaryotic-like serine/threonine-protein kinase
MPSRFNPDLDENWDEFIGKALNLDRFQRFSGAIEMMEELEHLAHLWQRKKENVCKISDPVLVHVEKKATASEIDSRVQRYKSIKVCPSKAKNIFRLDDLWRPLEYRTNEFISNPNDTVMDKTSGLIWQKSGCPYPLNWHQANQYIDSLNNDNFGGHDCWSLPTINELTIIVDSDTSW